MLKLIRKMRIAPKLIVWPIAGFLKLWSLTQRFFISDPNGILDTLEEKPAIFVIWHNRLLLLMIMTPVAARKRICFLASRSRDGGYIADILKCFQMIEVRGSTGKAGVDKGGARALVKLRKNLKAGLCTGITPDGPRGPRYEVQNGAIWLAAKTGVPIVPISYNSRWHLELGSWDKVQLPLPFSKGEYIVGDPVSIPEDLNDESLAEYKETVRAALMAISRWDHDDPPSDAP